MGHISLTHHTLYNLPYVVNTGRERGERDYYISRMLSCTANRFCQIGWQGVFGDETQYPAERGQHPKWKSEVVVEQGIGLDK